MRTPQDVTTTGEAFCDAERFFALSPDLLAVKDTEGRFLRVSGSWRDMLGWTEEEMLGRRYRDFVHPDDFARTRLEMERVRAGTTTMLRFENRYRHKGGGYRWLQWTSRAATDGLVFAIAREVTAQRAAFDSLQGTRIRAEQLLVEAISAMNDGFVLFDDADNLILCNERYRRLYRYLDEIDDVIGMNFERILRLALAHGEIDEPLARTDPEAWLAQRLAHHRAPSEEPLEQHLTNGNWILISERRISGGGAVGIYTEITAQKRAERRLVDALESIQEYFVLWDADDRLVLCNHAYRDIYAPIAPVLVPGVRFEDILRRGMEAGLYHMDEAPERWLADRLADHRNPGPGVERGLADGRWFLVTERRTVEGGVVGVGTEITALKTQERRLRESQAVLTRSVTALEATRLRLAEQARDLATLADKYAVEKQRAEEASNAKSRFLAHMSHELRTPLNAIIGFSDIMRSGLFGPLGGPKYDEYAHLIFDSGRHLLDLINDVLDMSKVEAGRYEISPVPLDPGEAARDAVRLMKGWAGEAGIHLRLVLADDLPAAAADRRAIRQVLLNLLSNAVKFTPRGGQVTFAVEPADGMLCFVVKDTGIGIPAADLSRLGRPFEQAEHRPLDKPPGTGLGLALSKALVELHGGRLAIDSVEGVGTTVSFTLPCFAAPAKATG
ncbi:MAG TPA: PAS-domain containing protein [Alphaproteobacteria bacterium]|nr:PAS-domain containing protein [Alphaproteobacteria bacterium]